MNAHWMSYGKSLQSTEALVLLMATNVWYLKSQKNKEKLICCQYPSILFANFVSCCQKQR